MDKCARFFSGFFAIQKRPNNGIDYEPTFYIYCCMGFLQQYVLLRYNSATDVRLLRLLLSYLLLEPVVYEVEL